MTLAPGTRLGPYEIATQLGAGGMGEVYRATDTRLGREVAVKVLPAGLAADSDRLWRFEQEARAASGLNHTNVLTVFDVGSHQGSPYLVTELLEGRSLRDVLNGEEAIAQKKVLDWAVQIARGLAAAHERGIVHRDLKPENLFVCRDGRTKILDFGLAKLVYPERGPEALATATTIAERTGSGTILGTVGYMSPEQVRGDRVDARADLFALGCVLYELVTGRRAFRRDTQAETLTAILREEPRELDAPDSRVAPALARILRRLLDKDPQRRFQSAGDLAFALEHLADAEIAPAARGRRARRWWLPFAAAVALAALAAALWLARDRFVGRAGTDAPIKSLAVLPLVDFAGDPEQAYFVDGMTEALIAELAQVSALRVISRTSVMRFKGTTRPLPEIARELGVDALVEGSVLRSEGRVRITAQLVHGATDRHLWAQSYERDLRDVLALQSEIARAIAREVRVRLTPEEESRLGAARPIDPVAHEAFLKGRFFYNQPVTLAALARAAAEFERAVARDPQYAAAWAGLADCLRQSEMMGMTRGEAEPPARQAARRALEIDPNSPEAHAASGALLVRFDWNFRGGESHFRRALELSPGYATAHHRLGYTLGLLGRHEEALATVRVALQLDPLDPHARTNLVRQLLLLGRLDEARAEIASLREMDAARGARWEARLALKEGNYDRAIELARQLGDDDALAAALARAGRRAEALALLPGIERAVREGRMSREALPLTHVALGRHDDAFRGLEEAFADRASFLVELKINQGWDAVRADPRFVALLERIGLVEGGR